MLHNSFKVFNTDNQPQMQSLDFPIASVTLCPNRPTNIGVFFFATKTGENRILYSSKNP